MLPVLEGIIARRILLNFRVNPALAATWVPRPLEVVVHRGFAAVGVCLIRLEHLRPKGLPGIVGISSENMAHRVAVRFPEMGKKKEGVFIWRRDTDKKWMTLLGGRLFPGAHSAAKFNIKEAKGRLSMDIKTQKGKADVRFGAVYPAPWKPTPLFKTFYEARAFFRKGDCGFSCALGNKRLEGMRLKTIKWKMEPLQVRKIQSRFYEKLAGHSSKLVQFDCALMMRGIPHQWHELKNVPELESVFD